MPNITCLLGPAFSITGDLYFSGTSVSFQITFDDPSDQANVLAYEWYLDDTILIGQNEIQFAGQISCGRHTIGVRILSGDGWSGIKSTEFATCKIATELFLYGVNIIDEGNSTSYSVLQLYSDGSSQNVTTAYTFTSTTGGSFIGNIFTADIDLSSYDSYQVTITASKDGVEPLTKQVTVNNTTPIVQVSLEIVGPANIDEGTSAGYTVISTYSNGSQQDLTPNYTFSCTGGTFSGNILTIPLNAVSGDSRSASIYALQGGIPLLSKQITINDVSLRSGILVVDLFNNPALDVIGLIDNVEVTENHIPAYTGNNIIPPLAVPSEAMILASDYFSGPSTNWRFEFNIEKLVADYPQIQNFVFYIKGRSNVAGTLFGAFSVRTNDAEMTLQHISGSYMPSVIGGSNIVPLTDFSSEIVDGANGSYEEGDLATILKFTYNVPGDTITYTNQGPIEVSDFDFMAIRYHWLTGAGSDLDILVGYENNGTISDQLYVGFGQPSTTVPEDTIPESNAYLWWGLDNTGQQGYEGVLIGIKKFIAAYPTSPNIVEVGLYAVWFGAPITGDFSVELVTYKGGTMSLVGNNFVNEGGIQVSSNLVNTNTLMRKTAQNPLSYYKVGTIKYNKTTETAIIEIN